MQILVEIIIILCYKLKMFGVLIDGTWNVFCDTDAVAKTKMRAGTILKNKNIIIDFHELREAVTSGIMLFSMRNKVLIYMTYL